MMNLLRISIISCVLMASLGQERKGFIYLFHKYTSGSEAERLNNVAEAYSLFNFPAGEAVSIIAKDDNIPAHHRGDLVTNSEEAAFTVDGASILGSVDNLNQFLFFITFKITQANTVNDTLLLGNPGNFKLGELYCDHIDQEMKGSTYIKDDTLYSNSIKEGVGACDTGKWVNLVISLFSEIDPVTRTLASRGSLAAVHGGDISSYEYKEFSYNGILNYAGIVPATENYFEIGKYFTGQIHSFGFTIGGKTADIYAYYLTIPYVFFSKCGSGCSTLYSCLGFFNHTDQTQCSYYAGNYYTCTYLGACPALCQQCNNRSTCQVCHTSKENMKQIDNTFNNIPECRCQDNYYYSFTTHNCQEALTDGVVFDLAQSIYNLLLSDLHNRYNYYATLTSTNQFSYQKIGDQDIFIVNSTYSKVPQGVFNLILLCSLEDLYAKKYPQATYHMTTEYKNCTLHTDNDDFTVTFKISLKDILDRGECLMDRVTTGERLIYMYRCEINEWFLATENLPEETSAVLLKKKMELKVSVDSVTKNTLFYSGSQVLETTDSYTFLHDISTTSFICKDSCEEPDTTGSVVLVGENITSQISIDGEIADQYSMSLISVEFKYQNGTSSYIANDDCSQLTNNPNGLLQITCLVITSAQNLYLEIIIELTHLSGGTISGVSVMSTYQSDTQNEEEGENSENLEVLRSIVGPYIVCDSQDEECKKQRENSIIIEEKSEVHMDREMNEDKDKKYLIIIIVIVVAFLVILLLLLGIIYYIKRSKRRESQGKASE